MMRWALLICIGASVACGGAELRGKSSTVDDLIAKARENGALRCAPIELAMAESHNDFAKQELAHGNYFDARSELRVAETNAQAAIRNSPRHRCLQSKPQKLTITPKDTDGDGLNDDVDNCPKQPEDRDGWEDDDGCPDDDNDSDGIADASDGCPLKPEDKDGFEDADGCPDVDNDKDGLADSIDRCPDKAEDQDGHIDDDGCPDCDNDGDGVLECPKVVDKCPDKPAKTPDGCPKKYKLVVVTDKKIELKQTVYFATNRAVIKAASYALLNEVAQVLKDNKGIHVRIEGHTDSKGSNRFNLRLSTWRAASVRKYLIARGVPENRMVSKGYGESVPIADNRTRVGRSQNRRVEFVIVSR